MDKFLKRHELPKLSKEEIHNLNNPSYIKNIDSWFKIFLQRNLQDQLASQVNYTKYLKKK